MESSDMDKILLAMQRAAVIEERVPGLHVLNQFMEPHILAVLKEEELI
jgi:hypothetical protein